MRFGADVIATRGLLSSSVQTMLIGRLLGSSSPIWGRAELTIALPRETLAITLDRPGITIELPRDTMTLEN
jgi:hypothetical protein